MGAFCRDQERQVALAARKQLRLSMDTVVSEFANVIITKHVLFSREVYANGADELCADVSKYPFEYLMVFWELMRTFT